MVVGSSWQNLYLKTVRRLFVREGVGLLRRRRLGPDKCRRTRKSFTKTKDPKLKKNCVEFFRNIEKKDCVELVIPF